jgi:signal transduction histidine kinase
MCQQPAFSKVTKEEAVSLLKHRERQIAALRRMSESLSSQIEPDDLIRETLAIAIEILEADAGSVQMYDQQTESLVFKFVASPVDEHLIGFRTPITKGIAGKVLRTGQPDLAEQVRESAEFNPEADQHSGFVTKSMLTAALKSPNGQGVGVIQILNARRRFDALDLEVLEVLASQAATAIETARLMEAARKAEIVSIIGNISHDIKNMLTPIQSGIWTLQALLAESSTAVATVCSECPPGQSWGEEIGAALAELRQEYPWITDSAIEAAERVQSFTRDLADAVKGELAPPVFEMGELNFTIRDVARSLKLVAEKSGVVLQLDLDANLPPLLFDRKQMYNAVYNLANNAIPETPRGGSVTLRTRRSSGDEVLIQVQDTGNGIPENVRAKLFTEQAISTKPGGTGLGTRIVAGVVERHHGRITVESEIEKGSTFSICLPRRQNP